MRGAQEPWFKSVARAAAFSVVDFCSRVVTSNESTAPRAPSRILVIELAMIGDLLLTTPLLRSLRGACPGAYITLLCTPWAAPAVDGNCDVDDVWTYPAFWEDRVSRSLPRLHHLRATAALARRFRSVSHDVCLAVSIRPQPFIPLLAWLSGAPVRVGFAHGCGDGFLTKRLIPSDAYVVAEKARLVTALWSAAAAPPDAPRYVLSDSGRRQADEFLRSTVGTDRALVCLCAPTSQHCKQWSAAKWGATADRLCAEGYNVVLTGTPNEARYVHDILSGVNAGQHCASAAGSLSFGGFAALLARSACIITVESAAMHLAAAFERPCVVLASRMYDYRRFVPRHRAVRVLARQVACAGCGKGCRQPHCMDFTVEEVLEAARAVMHHGERRVTLTVPAEAQQ